MAVALSRESGGDRHEPVGGCVARRGEFIEPKRHRTSAAWLAPAYLHRDLGQEVVGVAMVDDPGLQGHTEPRRVERDVPPVRRRKASPGDGSPEALCRTWTCPLGPRRPTGSPMCSTGPCPSARTSRRARPATGRCRRRDTSRLTASRRPRQRECRPRHPRARRGSRPPEMHRRATVLPPPGRPIRRQPSARRRLQPRLQRFPFPRRRVAQGRCRRMRGRAGGGRG